MQLNKSFLAIGNGRTDGITDICDSRVAFATENRGFSEFGTISLRTPPPYQIVKNIIVKIGPYS